MHNQVWAPALGLKHLISFHFRVPGSFPLTRSTVAGMCQEDQLVSPGSRGLGLHQWVNTPCMLHSHGNPACSGLCRRQQWELEMSLPSGTTASEVTYNDLLLL